MNVNQLMKFRACLAAITVATTMFSPALPIVTVYAANPTITIDTINGSSVPSGGYSCPSNPLFNPVTIIGHGAASYTGYQLKHYHVEILAISQDGSVTTYDNLESKTDLGNGNFSFTFKLDTQNLPTNTVSVKALLYHSQDPGNDNQVAVTLLPYRFQFAL